MNKKLRLSEATFRSISNLITGSACRYVAFTASQLRGSKACKESQRRGVETKILLKMIF